MIRTKLAMKILTKKDQTHLTDDAGVISMEKFIKCRTWQRKQEAEPCWHCAEIARKLGIED